MRNSSHGRVPQLLAEDLDDLARPEELVLEVDQPLGCAQGAEVGGEDGELARGQRVVDVLGHRAGELDLHVASGRVARAERGQDCARDLAPAHAEVRRDLRDDRALDERAGVVPAERAAVRMPGRVEAVACEIRQVDPSDEGSRVVDDHELLVMAVHRPFPTICGDVHPGDAREPIELRPDILPPRTEERQRRARPREHVHLDPRPELAQQVLERQLRVAPVEHESGREEPAGEQHPPASTPHLAHHRGQRVGAVHEDLDAVASCRGGRPERWPGVERVLPADAAQAPAMVRADAALDPLADDAVDPVGREVLGESHPPSFPVAAPFTRGCRAR